MGFRVSTIKSTSSLSLAEDFFIKYVARIWIRNNFKDYLIAEISFLLAVAVKVTTGTEGNVAHNIASLE